MASWSYSSGSPVGRWPLSARARPIWPPIAASVALHLAAATPFLPISGAPPEPAAPRWAQVELVQQPIPTVGAAATPSADTSPAGPAPPTTEQNQAANATAEPPHPAGEPAEAGAEAGPAPVPEPASATAGAAKSQDAQSADSPAVRLGDVGETGTGLVSGSAVIPAGLDSAVRNRLPAYPAEAARRGEEGVVILLAHIAPDGHATTIDVQQTSGYERLDQAARAAVSSWQFRPAMRDDLPIPSVMEVEVHFDIKWKPK